MFIMGLMHFWTYGKFLFCFKIVLCDIKPCQAHLHRMRSQWNLPEPFWASPPVSFSEARTCYESLYFTSCMICDHVWKTEQFHELEIEDS